VVQSAPRKLRDKRGAVGIQNGHTRVSLKLPGEMPRQLRVQLKEDQVRARMHAAENFARVAPLARAKLHNDARLREIHGRDLPAVLVTADRSTEVRAAAAALDVPVINKPLKPAVLRSMMARVRPLASAAE